METIPILRNHYTHQPKKIHVTSHTLTSWKQKHMIQRWVEYSRGYRSIALHSIVCGYKTRGKWNRELRIDGVKMRLLNGIQWVTKRHSRWSNVG